jgi:two-component system sensor histidine kinase DesK
VGVGAFDGEAGRRVGGPLEVRPGRWRWTVFGSLWLVFLADAVHEVVTGDHSPVGRGLGLAGIAVFCLAYALGPPTLIRTSDWRRVAFTAAMFVLATALLPVTREQGLSLYVFVAVVAIMLLPTRQAILVVAGLLVISPLLWSALSDASGSPLYVDLPIATAAAAVFGLVSVIRRNAELREAREELAELAVSEERARFARDLHDLLGHSLTVITVKSELARRLVTRDPARAEAELADIERLSREALADVRATVAGYREVSLPAEIANARSVLAAAGVDARLPSALDDVPGEVRELFAWVVREGVTNVVRHSGARHCWITVSATAVEVADDGRGAAAATGHTDGDALPDGHGLDGLEERVEAAGGRLLAGARPGGGFVLRAELPAVPPDRTEPSPAGGETVPGRAAEAPA